MSSPMYVHPSSRSASDTGHVLRTIGGCGAYASHRLAAEERYEAAAAATARMRFRRESGLAPAGIPSRFAALRALVGSTLIRAGERLRGQPQGAATRLVHGA